MTMSANVIGTNPAGVEAISPYHIITMLLDGALERVDQAILSLDEGDNNEAFILIQKTIGIVGGLRDSLDLDLGGDIAFNLDALYEYIVSKLNMISQTESPLAVLNEVKNLLAEVYDGWNGISEHVR